MSDRGRGHSCGCCPPGVWMWRIKASSPPRSCRQQGVRQGQWPFLRVLPPRRVNVAHEGIQPPPGPAGSRVSGRGRGHSCGCCPPGVWMWRTKASSPPRSCRQQGVRKGLWPGPFLRVLPPRRVDVAHEGIQPPPVLAGSSSANRVVQGGWYREEGTGRRVQGGWYREEGTGREGGGYRE